MNGPGKALAKSGGPCQRQWGMFFAGDATNCGDYVNCVDGNPYLMKCPESLAWDAQSWNCNFADLVPTCNAEGKRFIATDQMGRAPFSENLSRRLEKGNLSVVSCKPSDSSKALRTSDGLVDRSERVWFLSIND